jgi:uncharacterized membrane protein YqaE (UPF0057 family)
LPDFLKPTINITRMKTIITRLSMMLLLSASAISPSFAINVMPSGADSTNASKDTATAASKEKIDEALKEFKSLSKHERKERIKDAKKMWKQYKFDKKNHKAEPNDNTVLLAILAILLPPLAVYLHEGVINTKFWISIILTLLFWIPGVIYALIVVLS